MVSLLFSSLPKSNPKPWSSINLSQQENSTLAFGAEPPPPPGGRRDTASCRHEGGGAPLSSQWEGPYSLQSRPSRAAPRPRGEQLDCFTSYQLSWSPQNAHNLQNKGKCKPRNKLTEKEILQQSELNHKTGSCIFNTRAYKIENTLNTRIIKRNLFRVAMRHTISILNIWWNNLLADGYPQKCRTL